MNRSRRLVAAAAAVSLLGVGLAFSTRLTGTARAAVGPIPPEALALPADNSIVMGFDVRALTSSQFYAKFGGEGEPGRVDALAEIERKTGLNPARDIDSVVVAIRANATQPVAAEGARPHRSDNALVFVTGRFDAARLESSIPEAGKASKERRDGVTLYREATGQSNGVVALLDAGILVAGDATAVETFLANRSLGVLIVSIDNQTTPTAIRSISRTPLGCALRRRVGIQPRRSLPSPAAMPMPRPGSMPATRTAVLPTCARSACG